jgi:ribosome-associated translation inhibitor RaiA
MSATLTYDSRYKRVSWPPLLARQLGHWHSLTTLTKAQIILEHRRQDAKAYQVEVRLEIPGQALRTFVKGSTLEGALFLANQDLENQIQACKSRPHERAHKTRQPSVTAPRRAKRKNRAEKSPTSKDLSSP